MANLCRKIGINIYSLMKKKGITPEDLADALHYSLKDMWNVIEGKVMIPPVELERVAGALGSSKDEIMKRDMNESTNGFNNPDNLDKVLDLIDEYVEIKEAI